MYRLLNEIRERGVLRAAGLYLALVWLLLQIADVVFPAFEIPDSTVRYILYGAVLLFMPVMLFSWFYEITSSGLVKDADARNADGKRKSRDRRFGALTIGVLALALSISVFFNVQQVADEEEPVAVPDNVSLLIADAVNNTGDPIFEGVLEQALSIGLEGASFINSAPRHLALSIADQIGEGEGLGVERARLVALREDIQLVLVGEISNSGDGYQLSLQAIDPASGEVATATLSLAAGKSEVLQAVASLTYDVREALGDVTIAMDRERGSFSAGSLEAVSFYTRAQDLGRDGKDREAVELYRQAVEADPKFGRAYSGWALSEFNLGHLEKSEELWQKTISMLEGMNERERYRTLGLYYSLVTNNFDKAIENYRLLVQKFPADGIAHNNLAVAYFMNRQFEDALNEGSRALEIYPNSTILRTNNALYAMYLGDYEIAEGAAQRVIELDPGFHKAYLALAIAALGRGDLAAAESAYQLMAELGDTAASLASTGLADVALFSGRPAVALEILESGVAADQSAGNQRGAQRKQSMQASAMLAAGDLQGANPILAGLEGADSLAILVPVARMKVATGDYEGAQAIATQLSANLLPEYRAAGDQIVGDIHLAQGNFGAAVDSLNLGLARIDSWLVRFDLGRAYALAGFNAEALSEFELCQQRIGEASSLFLDDQPTFRATAELYYWLGRVRQDLGMQESSQAALQSYLSLQGEVVSDLVIDAKSRLGG